MIDVKPLLVQAHIEILCLVDSVIDDFGALDIASHSQAPAEMGLLTLWDEFKEQVQNGKSIYFVAYEATMEQFAKKHVSELLEGCDAFRLTALWLTIYSGGDFLRDEDSTYDRLQGALEYSTYERLYQRAKDEEIQYRSGYGPNGKVQAKEVAKAEVNVEQVKEEADSQNSGDQMSLF